MRKVATIILMSVLCCTCVLADILPPKHEIRAVWLTTLGGLDWPKTYSMSKSSMHRQQKELTDILDKLHDAGINAVLFQVRTRSAVLYPSLYEPWAPCVSGNVGKSPGYDPLKFAIDECHKRGIELHAWVTTIPAGKWNSDVCKRLRKKLPGVLKRDGADGFMDPANHKTAKHLTDICAEIAKNYDIDGIHLDYIRYPENYRLKISASQARNNITDIVKSIRSEVKSIKPWVKMSCSPIGKYSDLSRYSSRGWNARDRVYQDAQAWMENSLMDILFPMMYFKNNNYFPFLFDWDENKCDGYIATGLGAYRLLPSEGNWNLDEITRQMYVARNHNTGYAFFRSKFLTENTKGLYDFTRDFFNAYPALMPVMHQTGIKLPKAPNKLDVKYSSDYYILSWDAGQTYDKSPYCMYNLYASDKYPVNTEDSRNLIRNRLTSTRTAVKICSRPLYFAVTTSDRYGRESEPVQQFVVTDDGESNIILCENNEISIRDEAGDTEFIVVESLQGNIISTLPYRKDGINMNSIVPGMYMIRTLNSRGISHRIGVMLKK